MRIRLLYQTTTEVNKDLLLARIGGPAALEATVDIFYSRLVADESLAMFCTLSVITRGSS